MTAAALRVEFLDRRTLPQCAPNPAYPDGVDVNLSDGRKPACRVDLPKVATVGLFRVTCRRCGQSAVVTAAGRAEDPRSFTIACAAP
jgi:hypothetical protein